MKVTRLIIKNIGMIADTDIELNKPLLLFYGEIRQGKSTILNAVRWVCGGSFPEHIIRDGQEEASVEIQFDGGSIKRSWYKGKGGTKARDIDFVKAGRKVSSPAAEIRRFLNPFLLDQDYLRNMTEAERRQYFVETFPVDTADLDLEAFTCLRKAEELRATIKGYGHIDLTPVPEVNAEELKAILALKRADREKQRQELVAQLDKLREEWDADCAEVDKINEDSRDQNTRHNNAKVAIVRHAAEVKRLEEALELERRQLADQRKALDDNPILTFKPKPAPPAQRVEVQKQIADWAPSTPEIDELQEQVNQAAANQVRLEALRKNQDRAKQKAVEQEELTKLEARQREIKKEKTAKLTEFKIPIPGLAFNEAGQFTYEGTDAGMLSTSQIMKLSELLSGLYPEGFGLSLIDRAESLGKSIFEFVERAAAEKKTILATIVGEAPAKAPPEVGVFVVEHGTVTKKQTELI